MSLLRALDWETEGTEGLWVVNRLVSDALRSGLQASGKSLKDLLILLKMSPTSFKFAILETNSAYIIVVILFKNLRLTF